MTSPITRVGIVVKERLTGAAGVVSQLRAWLTERGVHALDETEMSRDQIPKAVDVVIVLGGDGTLLSMANRVAGAKRDIPILAVNFGSLGFLTEVRVDEMYSSLETVLEGSARFDERLMLEAEAMREGAPVDHHVVLNDVVFTKAALSRMIELSVLVNGALVTVVKADGLIVASPTGSTAYNLAAGGPIVHPAVAAFVLTPIAPHMLTNRPIVIPASSTVDVQPKINSGADDIFVTYDGQTGYPLQPGDIVRIRRAEQVLRLVRAPRRSYFELLREKLKWGER